MQPFARFPPALSAQIRFVLTDVDDTLTDGPRLSAATYAALERLSDAGITVIPVTAAPAGWCDLMCRMWPVGAVIGENGGLCFRHERASGATARHYWDEPTERAAAQARLAALAAEIVRGVPGAAVAHDQQYREATLAFRRDAAHWQEVLGRLQAAGARATVNSIWVLAWFGEFDKLAMTRRMLQEFFAVDLAQDDKSCLYVGDSPNDAPMFGFFPYSVGVASVRRYADALPALPRWVTRGAGGAGFVEVAEAVLRGRSQRSA